MSLKSLSSEHPVSLKGQTLKCIRRDDAAHPPQKKKFLYCYFLEHSEIYFHIAFSWSTVYMQAHIHLLIS